MTNEQPSLLDHFTDGELRRISHEIAQVHKARRALEASIHTVETKPGLKSVWRKVTLIPFRMFAKPQDAFMLTPVYDLADIERRTLAIENDIRCAALIVMDINGHTPASLNLSDDETRKLTSCIDYTSHGVAVYKNIREARSNLAKPSATAPNLGPANP